MSTNEKQKKPKVTRQDVARFAWHYWRPNWHLGAATAVIWMISIAADSVIPVYMGRIVDAMTQNAGNDAAAAEAAWTAFAIFAGLGVVHHACRVGSMYFWTAFAVKNLHAIINDGMRKVQRFSADWHANAFAGATVRKLTRCMWAFDVFEDTWMWGILPAATIMVCMTVMLGVQLPEIGLAAAAVILFYTGVSVWMSVKILAPRFTESAREDTKVGAVLADIITGNPTVKAFATEKREDDLFGETTDVWARKSRWAWNTGVSADGVRSVIRVGMMTGMVAATIMLWQSGRATPGDITLVLTSFMIIGGYLRDIGRQISQLQRSVSDMEDGISFWLREDDVVDAPGAKALVMHDDAKDRIVFENVGFKYPAGPKWIYRGMDVAIGRGEKLALVGASGSGKSTFVKLIQRLYNLSEGRILVDGQDISQVTMESLRQNVSLVPQDPILFHRSLAENIAYGKPGASMEEIVDAAKRAYAHDFIQSLSHGYDTLVGERGVKLSGGERQRVAIARAILADAPILILDEATSSLDSISEHYIQKALESLMEGRTTITIAHRLSTIQQADRILVFNSGEIVEQGSHAALMAYDSRYKALYDMQALELTGTQEEKAA